MIKYFKSTVDDPLFLRIVMAIWGLPFTAILVLSAANFDDFRPDYWLFVLPAAVGALGLFLLYTAFFADDGVVDERTSWLGDGGELIGVILIVVVILVAIPIWELLKLVRSEQSRGE